MSTTQSPADFPPTPSLAQWLALSRLALNEQVSKKSLALFISIDGTQRHYFMHQTPAEAANAEDEIAQIKDFQDYANWNANGYIKIFELLFSLGIQTIVAPLLIENNFWRGEKYVRQAIATSKTAFFEPPFSDFYTRWQVKARLYGDYAFAPAAEPVRADLLDIETRLKSFTPQGERTLLLGYCAGSITQEIISRTCALQNRLGREPNESELATDWFPDGPARLHLAINSGWLISGGIIPAIFANQAIDIYTLSHLVFGLDEVTLRRILYDHLFRRHSAAYDDTSYSKAQLSQMANYYQAHRQCFVGEGQLIGPGLWYPDHPHLATFSPEPSDT